MGIGFCNITREMRSPSTLGLVQPPALLSVRVEDDEDVEWQWTHLVDGRSMVTGYRIVNRLQWLNALQRRFHD